MEIQKVKGEPFFFYYSAMLLTLVVGGFGINSLVNYEDLPPISTVVIAHGTFMTCWYTLLVVQTGLIRSDQFNVHRTLGGMSLVLTVGMIISGIFMSLDSFARLHKPDIVAANLFMIVNFIILYSLALYKRRDPVRHKRLMLLASLTMLLPALGRIAEASGVNGFFTLPFWLILMIMLVVYDIRTQKKVQKVTLLGIALMIIGITFTIATIDSQAWMQFLENTIG